MTAISRDLTSGKNSLDLICLYEGLRKEVMTSSPLSLSSKGHGLVVQRGLAAWAETQSALLSAGGLNQVKPRPPAAAAPIFPGEIKTQATQILARMALNCLTEIAI